MEAGIKERRERGREKGEHFKYVRCFEPKLLSQHYSLYRKGTRVFEKIGRCETLVEAGERVVGEILAEKGIEKEEGGDGIEGRRWGLVR